MSHELDPKVGRWYRRLDDEQLFKVASIDEDDGLVEIASAFFGNDDGIGKDVVDIGRSHRPGKAEIIDLDRRRPPRQDSGSPSASGSNW